MAGVRDKPANLRRGIAPIRGGIIDELNELSRVVAKLDPESGIQAGLGTRLARELNRPISILNARVEAQTGRRGPVVIAKQTKKPIERKFQVAADFNDQPITGIGFPEKGSDAINLDYFRRFLNCDWFEKMWDECIEEEPRRVADGLMHDFYGYTYDIPNESDTVEGDPGNAELGFAYYWQMLIPETTIVDRVSWMRTSNASNNPGNIRFAIYDMNTSKTEYSRVAVSDPLDAPSTATILDTTFTQNLDSRVTLEAGIYAIAYAGPCFGTMLCITQNALTEYMVNGIDTNRLLRYGTILIPTDGENELPETLDSSNTYTRDDWFSAMSNLVPLTYWDDSEQFA